GRCRADVAQARLQVGELRLEEGGVEVRRTRAGHVLGQAGEVVVEGADQRAEGPGALGDRGGLVLERRRGCEQRAGAHVETGDQRLAVGGALCGGGGRVPTRPQLGAQARYVSHESLRARLLLRQRLLCCPAATRFVLPQ